MTSIDPNIFKSYDIRGIYPSTLNEENIRNIAQGIYTFFKNKLNKKNLNIVVGRDMRLSGEALYKVLVETFVEMGGIVTDIGLASTPTLYYATFVYKYDAGVQLTASHNPPEYNGLKIAMSTDKGLIKIGKSTGMDDIRNLTLKGAFTKEKGGKLNTKKDILKDEVRNLIKFIPLSQNANFKIVSDPANAMGGLYVKELLKHYKNINHIQINSKLDGSFPNHQPDPLVKENLTQLQEKILETKADLGLAPDGDGDRMFFIDEIGEVVPASIITSIIAKRLLKKYPKSKILFDIRYTLTATKNIQKYGGTYEITRVGHAFITEQMTKTNAIFGGESSGHYFFSQTGNAESQIPIITGVLAEMEETKKTLSELIKEYKQSYESGEFNFEVTQADKIKELLKEKYQDGKLNEIDGIAISYPNWRFGVRTSNTEPLLRLNVESTDEQEMIRRRDELTALIKNNL